MCKLELRNSLFVPRNECLVVHATTICNEIKTVVVLLKIIHVPNTQSLRLLHIYIHI